MATTPDDPRRKLLDSAYSVGVDPSRVGDPNVHQQVNIQPHLSPQGYALAPAQMPAGAGAGAMYPGQPPQMQMPDVGQTHQQMQQFFQPMIQAQQHQAQMQAQQAQEAGMQGILGEMGRRNILRSGQTLERTMEMEARERQELQNRLHQIEATYGAAAAEQALADYRQQQQMAFQAQQADVDRGLAWDQTQYQRQQDEMLWQYKRERDQIDDAWQNVMNTGVVGQEESVILGIDVGTVTAEERRFYDQLRQQYDVAIRGLEEQAAARRDRTALGWAGHELAERHFGLAEDKWNFSKAEALRSATAQVDPPEELQEWPDHVVRSATTWAEQKLEEEAHPLFDEINRRDPWYQGGQYVHSEEERSRMTAEALGELMNHYLASAREMLGPDGRPMFGGPMIPDPPDYTGVVGGGPEAPSQPSTTDIYAQIDLYLNQGHTPESVYQTLLPALQQFGYDPEPFQRHIFERAHRR